MPCISFINPSMVVTCKYNLKNIRGLNKNCWFTFSYVKKKNSDNSKSHYHNTIISKKSSSYEIFCLCNNCGQSCSLFLQLILLRLVWALPLAYFSVPIPFSFCFFFKHRTSSQRFFIFSIRSSSIFSFAFLSYSTYCHCILIFAYKFDSFLSKSA